VSPTGIRSAMQRRSTSRARLKGKRRTSAWAELAALGEDRLSPWATLGKPIFPWPSKEWGEWKSALSQGSRIVFQRNKIRNFARERCRRRTSNGALPFKTKTSLDHDGMRNMWDFTKVINKFQAKTGL